MSWIEALIEAVYSYASAFHRQTSVDVHSHVGLVFFVCPVVGECLHQLSIKRRQQVKQ